MASLYSDAHRALQEEFGTTKLAVRLDEDWVHESIQPEEGAFIGSRDMFFLSTVDPDGMPTVSYKGGPTGFVKVLDASTLVFPGFDGNGMFYSMGNVEGQAKVGLLFIDFETPHRIRVQGRATLLRDDALMAEYTEAKYLVRVEVTKIWSTARATSTSTRSSARTSTCRSPTGRPRSPPGSASTSPTT